MSGRGRLDRPAAYPYNRPIMERVDRAARDAILQRVFPDLRCGDDPDIGRYFELRAAGRHAEALAVYNRGLKPRYPDDSKRSALLNLYRRRDPGFAALHDELLWELQETTAARMRSNLDALCARLEGVPLKNTYLVLKALDAIAGMLPAGPAAALGYLDTCASYADILDYRRSEIRRIRRLAGEYFEQASESGEEDSPAPSQAGEEGKPDRKRKKSRDPGRIDRPVRDGVQPARPGEDRNTPGTRAQGRPSPRFLLQVLAIRGRPGLRTHRLPVFAQAPHAPL